MNNKDLLDSKIYFNRESLKTKLQGLKNEGEKVTFSNGCFDILHKGHVDYLSKASDLSEIFVIGVNTDESIKRLKGEERPLQVLESRLSIMASLFFVDFVIPFDEDTPLELIKTILPNYLVKGDDYKAEDIVGYDIVTQNGGEVITIELTQGYSTTSIVEQIKKSLDGKI